MKLFNSFLEQTFAEHLLHAKHWFGHPMAEEEVMKKGNYCDKYYNGGEKQHISITIGM